MRKVIERRGGRAARRKLRSETPLVMAPALVRNVARVVEFHSVSLVLLVAITPSRQRLGDLLGRTVVVEFASTLDVEVGSDEAPPTPDN